MVEPSRRAAVITVSDGVSHGTRQDESGDTAESLLRDAGFDVDRRIVVPDDAPEIERALREQAKEHGLVVTTGGTVSDRATSPPRRRRRSSSGRRRGWQS